MDVRAPGNFRLKTSANQDAIAKAIDNITARFKGDLHLDGLTRTIYSNDASVYQEMPAVVAMPRDADDVRLLIELARETRTSLIPRAGGTSLAGQVVGGGIVVDVSRFMNRVLAIDPENRSVTVQPGVIRDELNMALAGHGLFFAPETSTSNRATIGGMLGNNSCGANSIVYGTTRENVLAVTGLLADGSLATFGNAEVVTGGETTSQRVLHQTYECIAPQQIQRQIRDRYPDPEVTRRNTGYALDRLVDSIIVEDSGRTIFDPCQLLAGSEGTLMFTTAIDLKCHPLPPTQRVLLCPQFESVDQALRATRMVMQYPVFGCELIDHLVIEGAARNLEQREHLEFLVGAPRAVLIVDLRGECEAEVNSMAQRIAGDLGSEGLGYAFPEIRGQQIAAVQQVRKAGLGVVANVAGDSKPVTVIEDTAVSVNRLPDYIADVDGMLQERFGVSCVHYGHAGAGELHLRPVLNLKDGDDVLRFRDIATEVAAIVRRYRGSLSGEHGDGRLRGEFLASMIGEANYQLLRDVKAIWDPDNIFNPGKIVDAPSMTASLRYPKKATSAGQVETAFRFSDSGSLLQAAEMCSGSGDCRKTHLTGGVMCPSYMATRDERDSTRARANTLRTVMTESNSDRETRTLDDPRIKEVMNLCLSCKGCKSECPSNVDMAKMKAEFLHQWQSVHGIPFRNRFIAGFADSARWASRLPAAANWIAGNRVTGQWLKWLVGFHPRRTLPRLHRVSLRKWFASNSHSLAVAEPAKRGDVWLFCDEFTNFNDVNVGIAAVEVLTALGFQVHVADHGESGRAAISQGMLTRAKSLANDNVRRLSTTLQGNDWPLIGIEPSALLTLRDEVPSLVDESLIESAQAVASRAFLIDEFLEQQIDAGRVESSAFSDRAQTIRLHGHCHQKVLSSLKPTIRMLQLPKNYRVRLIPSGCCGMAGAFGYEREHYDVSMKIGELVLFPTIRREDPASLIAAGGTSCRHQIFDGTGRTALHPVEILRDALRVSHDEPTSLHGSAM